jgi:hypothetical protein
LEQTNKQDAQGVKVIQVENNNKKVASILESMHQNTFILLRYKIRHIKDQGFSIMGNQ